MKTNCVQYSDNALIISIPTTCPEATHALLMKGLITCLQQNITATDRKQEDETGLISLAGLLQVLVPGENALLRMQIKNEFVCR